MNAINPNRVEAVSLAGASAALLEIADELTVRAWEVAAAEWAGIDDPDGLSDCFRLTATKVDQLSDWQRVLLIEIASYRDPKVNSDRGLKVLDTLATLTGNDAFFAARNEVEDELRPARSGWADPVFAGGSASLRYFGRV